MNSLPIDVLLPELCQVLALRDEAVLEAPPGAGKTTRVPLAFNVVGAVQAGTDFEEAIDSLTCDLVRCLCPVPGAGVVWRSADMGGVTLSAPEQAPPGDGLSAACVLLVVELTVQLPAALA